jgi:hypothetical protein
MADGNSGGANVFLGFLLGGVMVAVAIIGFFMWDNYKSHTGGQSATHITLNVKKQ